MHKEAAARITRRTVAELEKLGHEIAPMSYDVRDYAKLGLLFKLLHADDPQRPTSNEVAKVTKAITEAIADARKGKLDLSNRWESDASNTTRKGTVAVRTALEEQWFSE
jgi:biotin-independent malonate decarboxylase gamma subunit